MTLSKEQIEAALEALLDYKQADEDGIMVLTSREAIHVLEPIIRTVLQERLAIDNLIRQGSMVYNPNEYTIVDLRKGEQPSEALAALNKFAMACEPSNETMHLVREIRAALQRNAVPQGYALVNIDKPITNGMKAEFIGEFSYQTEEVLLDDDGDITGDTYMRDNVIPWDTCKEIYKKMLAFSATAPKPTGE